jgi:hypothetical protein
VLSQWNEPLYQAVYFNTNYEGSEKLPAEGSLLESISDSNFSKVLAVADRLQFVIYAGVLLYFLFCVRRDSNLLQHVLVIAMIGGFLFSIIWEAKARYIFPYYVTMFPVAAVGYEKAVRKAEALIGRFRKPKEKDNIIEFKRVA